LWGLFLAWKLAIGDFDFLGAKGKLLKIFELNHGDFWLYLLEGLKYDLRYPVDIIDPCRHSGAFLLYCKTGRSHRLKEQRELAKRIEKKLN
jgi:hypothetical protein